MSPLTCTNNIVWGYQSGRNIATSHNIIIGHCSGDGIGPDNENVVLIGDYILGTPTNNQFIISDKLPTLSLDRAKKFLMFYDEINSLLTCENYPALSKHQLFLVRQVCARLKDKYQDLFRHDIDISAMIAREEKSMLLSDTILFQKWSAHPLYTYELSNQILLFLQE